MKKEHIIALILNLGDSVRREVSKEKMAEQIWVKLDNIYLHKSLHNRLYLKQKLFAYRMQEDKSIEDQLDKFSKIVDEINNIEVKVNNEDKAITLLNALPSFYENLKDAMIFGKTSLTCEEVEASIKIKELQRKIRQ